MAQASSVSVPEPSPSVQPSGVGFRSTQKLRSADGYEMYLYTNHTIQMYDDQGRNAGSGTWQISGGELFIYAHSGSLIAKCSCGVSQGELKWVNFSGQTYRKK